MDVSVIIVNYNTKQLLADCLDSVRAKTKDIEYEVIVVDNDSHDGSQKMLWSQYPWVRLIETGENLGFGRANNVGMDNAKGKYLFLLNSDTILKNNALKIFFDYSETHKNVGVLGAILLGKDRKPCHSYGKFITPSSEIKYALSRYLPFLKDKTLIHPDFVSSSKSVDYITGADMWLTREVYKKTGGFDSDFFMYCEEVDWQKRMSDIGLSRLVIPGPEIIHLEGGSDPAKSNLWSRNRIKNIRKSKKIYYRKHFSSFIFPFFVALEWLMFFPISIFIKCREIGK